MRFKSVGSHGFICYSVWGRECRRSRSRDTNVVRDDAIDTSSNSFDVESALTVMSQNKPLTYLFWGKVPFSCFALGHLAVILLTQRVRSNTVIQSPNALDYPYIEIVTSFVQPSWWFCVIVEFSVIIRCWCSWRSPTYDRNRYYLIQYLQCTPGVLCTAIDRE